MLRDSALDDMIANFAVEEGLLLPEDVERARRTQDASPAPVTLTETLKLQGSLTTEQIEKLVRRARPITTVSLSEQVQKAMLDPKRRVGKYVLLDEIGRGGMGIVMRGWDTSLERHVAVKCLPASANAEDLARFRREAQTAAKLNHPNIVPVHEILEHEGSVYVVMELIDGKRLDQEKAEPRDIAVAIRDAANAIHFAHEKGIVHRDLKPANIMRDVSGRVWVMDFGLARPVSKGTTLTATGIIQGTPSYMSPEHATSAPFTPAADVYSLGATLYDLLTGELPFKAENPLDILRQIVNDDPVAPRAMKPSIAADLETITLKCLEKKPERRYRSAAELAQDLDRWLKGEAILAHPPSTLYRLVKFVQRRRAPIAAALIVLAAGGWLGLSTLQRSARIRDLMDAGRAAEADGIFDAARDAYLSALDFAPRNPEAIAGVARMEAELIARAKRLKADSDAVKAKLKAREEATGLLERARIALDQAARARYERKDYGDIVEIVAKNQGLIEDAVRKAPDLAVGHHLLGRSWSLRGEDDSSESSWRKAIELDPQYAAPHLELGRLLLFRAFDAMLDSTPTDAAKRGRDAANRKFTEAGREFASFGALARGTSPPIVIELARAMEGYARRDFEAVWPAIDKARQEYGRSEGMEEFHWLEGIILFNAHDADGSIAALSKALEVRPHYFEALYTRAGLYQLRDDYVKADSDFSRAIAIKPKFPTAWMQRGIVRRKLGRGQEGLEDLERAAKLAPEDPFVLLNLGVVRLDFKQLEDAEKLFGEVIRREPAWPDGYEMRGVARAMRGDATHAVKDFDRAIELHPTARAYLNRGQTLLDLDDREAALKDFETGASMEPEDSPARKSCLNWVEKLRPHSY